ncbi:MAG: phage tail tube protein, partial [Bdellovibrionales bacterium]
YLEVARDITIAAITWEADDDSAARAAGSFVDDGFEVGDRLTTGSPGNPGPFTIATVTALKLTFVEAVVDEVSGSETFHHFVKVGESVTLNSPTRDRAEIDVTHLTSVAKEYRMGLRDEGTITGDLNFLTGDLGQSILRTMLGESLVPRDVALTVPPAEGVDGYRWSFQAFMMSLGAQMQTDDKITQSFTMRITGAVTEAVVEAGA